MRHQSPQTTKRYVNLAEQVNRKVVENLYVPDFLKAETDAD